MKGYNLQDTKTLIGNWYEEREGQIQDAEMKTRSMDETYTKKPFNDQSEYQISYCNKHKTDSNQPGQQTPGMKVRKVPPRQAMMERQAAREITRDIQTEQLAAVDNKMYFTRGKYLEELPPYDPNLQVDYLDDQPITLYSENGKQKGRNSKFTTPIDHYLGHSKRHDEETHLKGQTQNV